MRQSIIVFLSALFLPVMAMAQTYDALVDWSPNSNTTANVWQYGAETTLGGVFTPFPDHNANISSPTYDFWSPDGDFVGPVIAFNSSANTINLGGSPNAIWPSSELLIAPEGLNHGAHDDAVLRWVAPSNGSINISGRFSDLQQATVTLNVLSDNSSIFISSYDGSASYQPDVPFNLSNVPVIQGQAIDFVVGAVGDDFNDVLGISASITESVPEPASLAVLSIGVLMIIGRRRA